MSSPSLSHTAPIQKLNRNDGHFIDYSHLPPKTQSEGIPQVMFIHGLRSDMKGEKALHLEAHCSAEGQGYTRFDCYGHGESSGVFQEGSIGQWLDDTLAIIDEVTTGPLILVGSSMGGWLMTLAALMRPDRIKGLIGIAPAPDFTDELLWPSLSPQQQDELLTSGIFYRASAYGDPMPISRGLIEEGRSHLVMGKPIAFKGPVALLHGTEDKDVPLSLSNRFMSRLESEDVVLHVIKGGDHRLSRPQDLALLSDVLRSMTARWRRDVNVIL